VVNAGRGMNVKSSRTRSSAEREKVENLHESNKCSGGDNVQAVQKPGKRKKTQAGADPEQAEQETNPVGRKVQRRKREQS